MTSLVQEILEAVALDNLHLETMLPEECQRLQDYAVQIWQLKQELEKSNRRNSDHINQIAQIKRAYQTTFDSKREFEVQLKAANNRQLELEAMNYELRVTITQQKENNHALKSRIGSLTKTLTLKDSEVKKLETNQQTLEEIIEGLKRENKEGKSSRNKKVKTLTTKLEEDNQVLADANKELTRKLQEEMDRNTDLLRILECSNQKISELEAKLSGISAQKDNTEDQENTTLEVMMLREIMDQQKEGIEYLSTKNVSDEKQIQELQHRNTQLEAVIFQEGYGMI